jgi:hypothetical protein
LPEGTHLEGTVVAAKKARWFHRSGQLRFNFREINMPAEVAVLKAIAPAATRRPAQKKLKMRTQASLQTAESTGTAPLKVDREGGVTTKESKTRFLAATAAVMLARRAGDNDPVRDQNRQIIGQNPNVAGRTVGGGFGFGLLGAAIAQSSRYVGTGFGYYGMAWSLYSTLIARGAEVHFGKNAMVDIRFNTRSEPAAAHSGATATVPAAGHGPKP